jgi:hypothetical protein
MAHINAESKDREDVYRYKSGWISKSRSFNSFKSSINALEQIFSSVGFVLYLKTKDLQDCANPEVRSIDKHKNKRILRIIHKNKKASRVAKIVNILILFIRDAEWVYFLI